MAKPKTGPTSPASTAATSGDVATVKQSRQRARSTDSATLQRGAVPALVRYMEAKHDELLSVAGERRLALRGDAVAARAVLARFIQHARAHRLAPASAEDWPDLRAAIDVVSLILAQPSASFRTALGFQGLRATRADRITALVVFYAVDHAQFNMGEFRTLKDACKMVAAASTRLTGKVFPRALAPDAVLKSYVRSQADDPTGASPLLQRARRLKDR